MSNLLTYIPRQLWNAARILFAFGRRELELIVKALFTFLITVASVTALGLIIAKIAFASNAPKGIDLGCFLVALAGAISGFFWLYIYVRGTVLVQMVAKGSDVLVKIVRQLSRPFPDTPVELPLLVSAESAESILRKLAAAFAAILGASAYAAVVPVYENLTGFLTVMVLTFFIAFGVMAGWVKEEKWRVKEKVIIVAFSIAMLITLSYFIPEGIKKPFKEDFNFSLQLFDRHAERERMRQLAEDDARESAKWNEIKLTQSLERQRDAILWQVAQGQRTLDGNTQKELDRINQLIAEVTSGRFTDKPSMARRTFNQVSDWQIPSMDLSWKEEVIGLLILAAVLFKLTRKPSTSSSGGHHV